jgi:hypothetical protein
MKALFGAVSLLVALAIVGLVMVKQLRAVGHVGPSSTDASLPAVPQMSGSGTVREQAQTLENKIANDAVKAMNQGAAAHEREAEKQ